MREDVMDVEQLNVFLTEDEYKAFKEEYYRAYRMYSGVPPSFEQFCRMKKHIVRRG